MKSWTPFAVVAVASATFAAAGYFLGRTSQNDPGALIEQRYASENRARNRIAMQEYPSAGITEGMSASERENAMNRYWIRKAGVSLELLRAQAQSDPHLLKAANDIEQMMKQAERISKR
jgi:hypothetical protein